MELDKFLSYLQGVRGGEGQYQALCPAHDDHKQSLSVSVGSDNRIILYCHAGCAAEDIVDVLGLSMKDLFTEKPVPQERTKKVVATYKYTDEYGNLLFQKRRYSNKDFVLRQPKMGGGWIYNVRGISPVLYNLPEVMNSTVVYIVEGEKDVETLRKHGKVATCGAHGAGKDKWLTQYNDYLKDKNVIIIQDNDAVGKQFAIETAKNVRRVAKTVQLLDLTEIVSDLPEHGDVTDLFEMMPDKAEELLAGLVAVTLEYQPAEVETAKIISLEEITPQNVTWLWYPYIPMGKITLLQADPGQGKTTLTLKIAAILSKGDHFPAHDIVNVQDPRKVLYQTAEDGVADTIKPRLMKMNPDFKNIYFIDESQQGLTLSDDRIEEALKKLRPALMIIDPLQAYLGADVDMHRANEVRPVLARIGHLAEQYQCAIIFIMHMSKMSQAKALYRGLGSIDIPAVARSLLVIGSNPRDPQQKIMAHEKSSLAKHGQSVAFRIDESQGIVFEGFSELTADEILNPSKESRDKPAVSLEFAENFLLDMLRGKGYMMRDELIIRAEEAEISLATLKRAKKELGVNHVSLGFGDNKRTWWIDPDVDTEEVKSELKLDEYNELELYNKSVSKNVHP